MTLLWQSSSLSTAAIIALVLRAIPLPAAVAAVLGANIGTTGAIWLAGLLVSDGMPKGDTFANSNGSYWRKPTNGCSSITVCW